VPEWLQDTSLRIILTEGPKKCAALWDLAWHGRRDAANKPHFVPVALSGVWNWRGTVGKQNGPHGERQSIKGTIPDFDRIAWRKRAVTILFDLNVHTNESARIARDELATMLRKRGAQVFYAELPSDAEVNGIDDYLGEHGPDAALDIVVNAYDPKQKADHQAALTEERLAQQFEAEYRERLKFDHDRGRWYVYDEEHGYWREDKTRRAYHYAREVCRNSNIENAKEFARARTYGGVEQICQNSPIFAVTSDYWNKDTWLLGTARGTVDLRTGTLRPARKNDYITKHCCCGSRLQSEHARLHEVPRRDHSA